MVLVCWPFIRRTARSAIKRSLSLGAVHHVRHIRRAHRIAAIVCVSVGGFGSAALIPPLAYAPPALTVNRAVGHIDLAARAPQPIPEPSSLALLLPAAVVAIAIAGRRA